MESKHLIITAVVPFLFSAAVAAQDPLPDAGPDHHVLHQEGAIEWTDGPASLAPGAQMAVLEGNPAEPGVFTMRIRMPDGFRIAPHWHPNPERVTVISGVFRLGSGDVFDAAATEALRPGAYTAMPPGMRHYAVAEGETVIQLTSTGPWEITYVDPADDPRANDRSPEGQGSRLR